MSSSFNGFLVRDALSDTGVVPSPGYPYYSPDLICHDQVANPTAFFAANYSSDPSQKVQLGSQTNLIYVRAKNLASTTLSGWKMFVYRASGALFLNTNLWRNNRLSTSNGNAFVPLPTTPPGTVAVGTGPMPVDGVFVLSGLSSNLFCLVAIASQTDPPVIPDPFSRYEDYITWVRSNQNVSGRNLSITRDYRDRQYSRIDSFSNPGTASVPILFQIIVSGDLPAGTTFGITSAPLDVNKSWNISEGREQGHYCKAPAGFNGTVTTWGSLPAGNSSWPNGTQIAINIYVGLPSSSPAARYAVDFHSLRLNRGDIPGLGQSGVLVLLGSTATIFQSGTAMLQSPHIPSLTLLE
jgi:hypothetical protein